MTATNYYTSPRWTNKILDCSMPMTFDTYNLCSYQCQYCFSYYQRSHYEDYVQSNIRYVNVEKVKKIFTDPDSSQFGEFVKRRFPIQWGGLSEPFDLAEKKLGISLEMMKFFREINYPVSFSSKSVWHLKDEAYREVLKGAKNFHFKVSIITLDEDKARVVEKAVPTPKERLWAISEYVKLGISAVNLRLRPFMIGISNPSHLELIKEAKRAGAYGVSTEFFCLEARANADVRKRYLELSKVCGFDIWEFYRKFSYQSGYRRLNYEIKRPYILEMEKLCKELDLKFFVSDANHKERCHHGSCCGLPECEPFTNYAKCQFTEAIVIAKQKGEVKFSDLTGNEHAYLEKLDYNNATGFNTANIANREKNKFKSMFDFMRGVWNNPKRGNSPYMYFDGLLIPDRVDENGDVVYKFNQKKYEGSNSQS